MLYFEEETFHLLMEVLTDLSPDQRENRSKLCGNIRDGKESWKGG